jgi:hypothetical protein
MRIGFIVGRSDPFDGITCYSSILAAELQNLGHSVSLLACNDDAADPPPLNSTAHGTPLTVIGRHETVDQRAAKARAWVAHHKPQVVSIQFNCHHLGDRRGILKPFTSLAAQALKGVPVHMFFHELWFNAYEKKSLSNWLKGLVRRHYVVQLIQLLRPRQAFTNTDPYARQLGRLGVTSQVVPVFSHIPVLKSTQPKASWRTNNISAVIFGTLPPHWQGERAIRRLGEWARSQGKELRVLGMGRHGYDDHGWDRLRKVAASDASFERIGVVSEATASSILSLADFGISVTDFDYWTKSTTIAAMIEHGLPVIFDMQTHLRLAGTREGLANGHCSLALGRDFEIVELIETRSRDTANTYLTALCDLCGR